jgi:hypothetical protein
MRTLDMAAEEKQGVIKCALGGICSEHPHTLERVAILEQALKDMKSINENVIARLDLIRDMTIDELKEMRKDMQRAILQRYSSGVVVTFSIMAGLLGVFITGLITVLITHYLP